MPVLDVRRRFARGLRNFDQAYKPLADQWAMYENAAATPILIQRHP